MLLRNKMLVLLGATALLAGGNAHASHRDAAEVYAKTQIRLYRYLVEIRDAAFALYKAPVDTDVQVSKRFADEFDVFLNTTAVNTDDQVMEIEQLTHKRIVGAEDGALKLLRRRHDLDRYYATFLTFQEKFRIQTEAALMSILENPEDLPKVVPVVPPGSESIDQEHYKAWRTVYEALTKRLQAEALRTEDDLKQVAAIAEKPIILNGTKNLLHIMRHIDKNSVDSVKMSADINRWLSAQMVSSSAATVAFPKKEPDVINATGLLIEVIPILVKFTSIMVPCEVLDKCY